MYRRPNAGPHAIFEWDGPPTPQLVWELRTQTFPDKMFLKIGDITLGLHSEAERECFAQGIEITLKALGDS